MSGILIFLIRLVIFGLLCYAIDKIVPMYDLVRFVFRVIVGLLVLQVLATFLGYPLPIIPRLPL